MRTRLAEWYGPYVHARVWKESAYLLLDLGVGIALFTIVITMLSLSAGLMVTLIGLPLLAATVAGGRFIAAAERVRVRALLDTDLPEFAPIRWATGWWPRMQQAFGDRPGWQGLLYGVLMLPWGVLTFTVVVVAWSVAWSVLTVPLWGWIVDPPPAFTINGVRYHVHGASLVGAGVVTFVVGSLLVAALPRMVHALARADAALVKGLLSPNGEQLLALRVSELETSREASVESSAGELRRIERDLHDGAQQRLVSLAMNLGMARERLKDSDDERAKEMVSAAHDDAKQAIAELRDLVRGIHPAVLTDRGLDAAVSALIARCPVPVTLHTDLPRRLGPAIEAAAYFVVAEALTNIAKHSQATAATIRMTEANGQLTLEIHDDGIGGATVGGAGGLHGLEERVRAVEGRVRIASPVGGPTVVLVELPCAS